MPTGHVMMAITLDGYVARKDHSLDWLMKQNTADEDHGFAGFLSNIDVIVMGSGSYRTVLGFDAWPYEKPVVVLSNSIANEDVPPELAEKVEIMNLSPQELVAEVDRRGWQRIYVDGGAIVQSFLKLGLINDFKLAIVPILLGDGIRLFGELPADIDLELTHTKSFPSGLVELRYKVV
ncbi:dihydrofolate reductase family protein [uncultured Roseibium sp.]|uniref:dihydrofolate reductase family protein n=1 Tax=uncultured Roseibium sp. TaxID=1936171 RepID=UPI00263003DB|nr:dihydrofolate reductase family protein [uncultured Roseibium sp.]